MGNFLSSDEKLDINKNIKIELKLNHKNNFRQNNLQLIKNFIVENIENMGSSGRNCISHYLNINSIRKKEDENLTFLIIFDINKNGKTNLRGIQGKKLDEEELKNLFTFNKLKKHVEWSLNENYVRGEPLKLRNNDFTISKSNIKSIKLISNDKSKNQSRYKQRYQNRRKEKNDYSKSYLNKRKLYSI